MQLVFTKNLATFCIIKVLNKFPLKGVSQSSTSYVLRFGAMSASDFFMEHFIFVQRAQCPTIRIIALTRVDLLQSFHSYQ